MLNENNIKNYFSSMIEKYKENLNNQFDNLSEYNLYLNDNESNFSNLILDYYYYCKNVSIIKNDELNLYEKSACIAVAIKNNPYFIVTDKFDTAMYTALNSRFAIDVALELCLDNTINEKEFNINHLYDNYPELDYTADLMADILESKKVHPLDISNNIKMEANLIKDIYKENTKNKTKKLYLK